MPNRAERRKAAKDQRRGVPSQYDQTRGRARSGMLDEYALQEKSRRIQEGVDDSGVWKPSARTEVDEEVESVFEANPNYQDPKAFKAPRCESLVSGSYLVLWRFFANTNMGIVRFFDVQCPKVIYGSSRKQGYRRRRP